MMHISLCENLENSVSKTKSIRKNMSFSLDNKLVFINSFQFLISSLDSLIFKDLIEFDSQGLDLAEQKSVLSL